MLLGISVDTLADQQKFTDKEKLTYPLLSDKDKRIARAYGVLTTDGRFAKRATFVIDKKGVLRKIDPNANAKKNAEEILDWVKEHLKEK